MTPEPDADILRNILICLPLMVLRISATARGSVGDATNELFNGITLFLVFSIFIVFLNNLCFLNAFFHATFDFAFITFLEPRISAPKITQKNTTDAAITANATKVMTNFSLEYRPLRNRSLSNMTPDKFTSTAHASNVASKVFNEKK